MKKAILVLAVLILGASQARAQDSYPSVEVFGGYSYLSTDVSIDDPFDDDGDDFFDDREGFHGAGFSVAGNVSGGVGIVADFSYHKREIELPGGDIDISNLLFLFGPRFTARGDRVDVFGHVLIGGVRSKVEDLDSDVNLALGFGGGLDIKASDSFAVRLFQIDYIPVRFENPITEDDEWSHNLRFQIGVTYRWGGQ
ncbi:MAG TPA: outer membrane beta-barrel protein [Blastocatellia bacterium]|nr:outer membrane beta-barrel protein [Blastocatellia bacterium]